MKVETCEEQNNCGFLVIYLLMEMYTFQMYKSLWKHRKIRPLKAAWFTFISSRGRHSIYFYSSYLRRGSKQKDFEVIFPFPLSLCGGWSWKSEQGSWSLQSSSKAPTLTFHSEPFTKPAWSLWPCRAVAPLTMKLWVVLCLALIWVELQNGEYIYVYISETKWLFISSWQWKDKKIWGDTVWGRHWWV